MNKESLLALEERLAWQENLIESLNDVVIMLNAEQKKMQQQLVLLHQEIQQLQVNGITKPASAQDEIPPHY